MQTERLVTAMLCAATVTGQFVAGKALRDTLFLTSLDVTALPAMLVTTSVVSLALVALNGRMAARLVPAVLVPASFLLSSVLFLIEWALRSASPTTSAVVLYLHISAAGPLLASGCYLVAAIGYWQAGNGWLALSFLCWAIANLGLAVPALR